MSLGRLSLPIISDITNLFWCMFMQYVIVDDANVIVTISEMSNKLCMNAAVSLYRSVAYLLCQCDRGQFVCCLYWNQSLTLAHHNIGSSIASAALAVTSLVLHV